MLHTKFPLVHNKEFKEFTDIIDNKDGELTTVEKLLPLLTHKNTPLQRLYDDVNVL